MNKRKMFMAVLLAVAMVMSLTGCFRKYVMERPDMYLAPLPEEKVASYSEFTFVLNPVLDLAEGGDGRFAWKVIAWDKNGQQWKEPALALSMAQFTGEKTMKIVLPYKLSELDGVRLTVVDHGGKRIYNQRGEYRELDSLWQKIDVEKYKDFLPVVTKNCGFAREFAKDSPETKALIKLYADFRIKEVSIGRKYIHAKYGSNLTAEQLEQIKSHDSIVQGLVEWLGKDWKLFVMYPFMDIGNTALVAGVTKVFTLPSIWGDRLDRPGYMEYKPDAEYTAKMVLRGLKEYGPNIQTDQQQLPEAIRQALRGGPCAEALTYDSYNTCAAKYNAQVLMENNKK